MKRMLIVMAVMAASLLSVRAHAFPGVVKTGVGVYSNHYTCGSTWVKFGVAVGRDLVGGAYVEHAELWDPGTSEVTASVVCPAWPLYDDGSQLNNVVDPTTSPFPWPLNYSATVCQVWSRPASGPWSREGTAIVYSGGWRYVGGVDASAPSGTINVTLYASGNGPATSCLAGKPIALVAR